jgi:hypothetical protein
VKNLKTVTIVTFAVPLATALAGFAVVASAEPNDPAKSQDSPALKTEWITSARTETAIVTPQSTQPPQTAPGTAAQYNPKEIGIDKIQSPRDPASGQSTGAAQEARTENPPTGVYASNPGGGLLGVKDGQSGGSNGAGAGNVGQFAESGRKAEEMIVGNPEVGTETVREGGANDTTHRTKKPRRDRNGTRGKRQHKP